jgi:hypothetical protein
MVATFALETMTVFTLLKVLVIVIVPPTTVVVCDISLVKMRVVVATVVIVTLKGQHSTRSRRWGTLTFSMHKLYRPCK